MNRGKTNKLPGLLGVTLLWLLIAPGSSVHAQNTNSKATEVYLSFQYRGIVGSYVTTYYKDQQFYLPVSELFNQLKIHHEINQGKLVISGRYLGEKQYTLDFNNQIARLGNTKIDLQASDFLIKEIDYFVKPEVFNKVFGLKFSTSFSNLTLDLKTTDKLPVIAQYERAQQRKRVNRNKPLLDHNYYPLKYARNYNALDGAFLDYNFTGVYTNRSRLLTFNNAIGAELLGGDIRGNIFGTVSNQRPSSFRTSRLRWRYVQRNNNYFSTGIVGQTLTNGISNRSITGFKISNKPVEPRRLFDRYIIDGNVPPQSEVELYLNNQMIDYQEADQSGNYRFVVPLTYGSTNYSVRIYKPNGQYTERSQRIQVPFDYLPPGEVDYSISGGRLQDPILGSTERGYIGAATVSTGITEWLTAQASTEYLTDYHRIMPSITGTLNARLFSNYLLSANINSENFYRLTSSVVYSNGASWSLSYDYNPGNSPLYNIGRNIHQGRLNFFMPFQLGTVPLNVRWSSFYQQNGAASQVHYRADLGTRLDRLNIRVGYQDQQTGMPSLLATPSSRLTNSYSYSLGRFNDVSDLLGGTFIRGRLSYLPGLNQMEEMELQLSRNILRTGRIQLSYGHNFLGNFNTLSLNFTLDFNKIRSTTTSRSSSGNVALTQSFRGSIGYNSYENQLLLNNRHQVGQAGAAVRLFVDNNNDGSYQDSTDDVIHDPAVRLNRAGGKTTLKNGVNYVSQLLPYYRYNMEINKGALSNPLLVPELENFSIVTDPNQYKTIEIPFYLSGVISGKVEQIKDSTRQGLSGVRLYLESAYEDTTRETFSKELRTFSDGSFYTYEIPPGKYKLFIDPDQLSFLNSVSKPDTIDIAVESLASGDFVENLTFTLRSKADTEDTKGEPVIGDRTNPKDLDSTATIPGQERYYKIQLASFESKEKAKRTAMEATQHLGDTFSVIQNTANGLYAIRSTPKKDRKRTMETIISYHHSGYESAALVALENKKRKISEESVYIQIGAFSTRDRAARFARTSSRELHKETAIFYNKEMDLYKVYLDEYFSSPRERWEQLRSIKKYLSFGDAYINSEGLIQLGAFKNQLNAKSFARLAGMTLKSDIEIRQNQPTNLYDVCVNQEFHSREQKEARLEHIKNRNSVFHGAFATSFPDPTFTRPDNGRSMNFTYEVQIKGVTENNIQAFLSSLTAKNRDSYINRPQKNLIVFDQVSTWNQAQELQKKLAKVSSIGHPIVILIEQSRSAVR